MKGIEIVKISKEILKVLSENDIRLSDVNHIELFNDYERMLSEGMKVTYIVEHLSDVYNVSVAQVYRILSRFKRTIKM